MPQVKMSAIREQFPMYADVPDDQLLIGLHKKFYSDIPAGKFYSNIDYDTERARLGKQITDEMGFGGQLVAGYGKAAHDVWKSAKRVGNMVGIGDYDQAAAQEDERLDQPLMNTAGGMTGHIAGDIVNTALPGYGGAALLTKGATKALPVALRGITPYVGAAGAGAGVGAATSPSDMAHGAAVGAAFGAGGEAAGRVGSAVYQGAKAALVDPLTAAGRERTVKRVIERFADDPAAVVAATRSPQQFVPGVNPTLAEATGDIGVAQLQRSAAATSPDVASALGAARGQQLTGYRNVLDTMAGSSGQRDALEAAREATAAKLYGQARAAGLDPAYNDVAIELMQRPAIREAVTEAQRNAKNMGTALDDAAGSVSGLQQVKNALDSKISVAVRQGDNDAVRSLQKAKGDLLDYLDQAAPAHGAARREYAAASRPINQMEVAGRLRDVALPALTDLQGVPSRINANAFARALRDADKTARQATGFSGATMEGTMTPGQMASLKGIERDMARYASAQDAGAIAGSRTAQHLGASNVIAQIAGPLGLPRSVVDSTIGRVTAGLLGLPFKLTQSQTEQLLARALTDPATARRVLGTRDSRTIAEALRPFIPQAATQASLAAQ